MWSTDVLEVNPNCEVSWHHLGPPNRKVVLVDNFYRYPQKVSELALNLYYTESRAVVGSYPGSRAMITLDTTPLVQALSKLWGEPLAPFHAEYHPVIFSAIQNWDYELTTWQRQPHIDQGTTAMVYLNPEPMCSGGTGLYRHRPSGFSRVPLELTPELTKLAYQRGFSHQDLQTHNGYAEFLNNVFFRPEYAAKNNAYINDGNDYWELLYRIDMKPNRLVIFDGRMFHSQHIAQNQFQDYFRINQILYFQGHD